MGDRKPRKQTRGRDTVVEGSAAAVSEVWRHSSRCGKVCGSSGWCCRGLLYCVVVEGGRRVVIYNGQVENVSEDRRANGWYGVGCVYGTAKESGLSLICTCIGKLKLPKEDQAAR